MRPSSTAHPAARPTAGLSKAVVPAATAMVGQQCGRASNRRFDMAKSVPATSSSVPAALAGMAAHRAAALDANPNPSVLTGTEDSLSGRDVRSGSDEDRCGDPAFA